MKLRQIREAQKRKNKNNISQMRERLCRLTYLYADGTQNRIGRNPMHQTKRTIVTHMGRSARPQAGMRQRRGRGRGPVKTIPYVAHPNFANVGRGLSAPTPLALPRGYFREDEWAVTRRYMTLETVAAICEDTTMDPAKIAAL